MVCSKPYIDSGLHHNLSTRSKIRLKVVSLRAVVLEAGAGLSVLAMVVRRSLTSTNERDRNIRSAGECLLTLSACLTQNGLSSFRNFSRMEILPLSCIIWHGYLTLEEEEEDIKKESIFTGWYCVVLYVS